MHESKLLSLLTHPCIFYQIKTPFRRNSVLLTGHHATPVVTLFFSLTHVTCTALHHTVVISCSTGVTYRTLRHASGHLVIYWECYIFERALFYSQVCFTLYSFLLFQGFPGASSSTSKLVGFMLIFKTLLSPDYLFES